MRGGPRPTTPECDTQSTTAHSCRAAQRTLVPPIRRVRPGRPGWTLHRLRHSALTHLGSSGRTAVELRAKRRHASLRALGRYVNPGPELAGRVTAETDPAARRRRSG
jgi:hypothetical protein